MEKEELIKLFTETGIEAETATPVVEKTLELHENIVGGLLKKRDELLGSTRSLKDKLEELKTEKETLSEKLSKFGDLDPTKATEALERLNNSPKDKEVQELIDEKAQKLTKTLREENESLRTTTEKTIRDQAAQIEELTAAMRQQSFTYELEKVANKVGVSDFAREDFVNRMHKTFRYNEEEDKFIGLEDNGEVMRDPTNPVNPITFEVYAEKRLKAEAPHIFLKNVNTVFNGNNTNNVNADKYFHADGRPTMDGYKLRNENEKEFTRLKTQMLKKLQKEKVNG